VDDEPAVLAALERVLRDEPLEAIVTQDPATVLDLVERRSTSLVVADQCMPWMTGTELLRFVRRISPGTRTLILSGHTTLDDIAPDIRNGTVGCFLRKPWDPADLKSVLRHLLGVGSTPSRSAPRKGRPGSLLRPSVVLPEGRIHRMDCSGKAIPELLVQVAELLSNPETSGGGATIILENLGISGDAVAGLFTALLSELRHSPSSMGSGERSSGRGEELLVSDGELLRVTPVRRGEPPEAQRVLLVGVLESPQEVSRVFISAGHALWAATEALHHIGPRAFTIVLLGPISGHPRWTEFARRVLARRLRTTVVAMPGDATTGAVLAAIRKSRRLPDPD
jgi:CheY-like chemotaxis protein